MAFGQGFNANKSDGFKNFDNPSSRGESDKGERKKLDLSVMSKTQPIFEVNEDDRSPKKKQRKFVGMQIVPKVAKFKTVYKQVFFGGAQYELEEQVRIDSDKESSIHTSSDEFEVNDDGEILNEFNQTIKDQQKRRPFEEIEKAQ